MDVLVDFFQIEEEPPALAPRYNVAPSTECPVVGQTPEGRRKLRLLRWGLIPSWAKDPKIGTRMINARAESVADKPAFRGPFKKRRVLVPADGFFEWKGEARAKQPYFIHAASGEPLAFAAIWDRWRDPALPEPVDSFAILTTEASGDVAPLHHRMPVILERQDWDLWLDPGPPGREALEALLGPLAAGRLVYHPVSKAVGNVRNDSPALVEPVEG